jgi:hypothetical protein
MHGLEGNTVCPEKHTECIGWQYRSQYIYTGDIRVCVSTVRSVVLNNECHSDRRSVKYKKTVVEQS